MNREQRAFDRWLTTQPGVDPLVCEWYALCQNDADGTTPHPILGQVPICQRCAAKHKLAITPFEEGA